MARMLTVLLVSLVGSTSLATLTELAPGPTTASTQAPAAAQDHVSRLASSPPEARFGLPLSAYRLTKSQNGQACIGNWMCESDVCGRFGIGFCLPSCTERDRSCPSGYVCATINGKYRCVKQQATRGVGGGCSKNSHCSTDNCSPATGTCVCTPPSQPCGEHCYMPFVRNETWWGAVATCSIGGGTLAVPRSQEQNACLKELTTLAESWSFWIGFNRLSGRKVDEFLGEDGWPMIWRNWGRDDGQQQPDGTDITGNIDHNDQFCVALEGTSGQWSDRHCQHTIPFICQFG